MSEPFCDACGAADPSWCSCNHCEPCAGQGLAVCVCELPEREPAAPRDLAIFELEMTRSALTDLWRCVFGDSQPMPDRADRAARRLLGPMMCVDWSGNRPQPPTPPKRLPLGVVRDDYA
jgi:hypothetical protein